MNTPTETARTHGHATPRPWAVSSSVIVVSVSDTRDCPVICNTMDLGGISGFPLKEAKANARLIVDAVNQHDALLAENARLRMLLAETTDALHDLVKDEVDDPAVGITGWKSLQYLVADAREALAGGEGGK